ncbi:MAG: DUF3857 domain-containing protein [Cytophagaceae bacterium]|nr:DUF3857 domain-containing protein [Cytophagaceae bacterium]|tara:strand:- start:3415 stop:5325 length:1911 start_codon:yes stop_codon:yes gene_type:complete
MRVTTLVIFLLLFVTVKSQDLQYSILGLTDSISDGVDSVIRDENIIIDVTDASKLVFKTHRVITIFNKSGLGDADAVVLYDNNTQVKDLEARMYDAMGNEIEKVRKRDFKDVSAVSGGTLYSDSRAMYLDYTPTTFPFTLVLDYEYTSKTTGFIAGWSPLANFDSSTQRSTYELLYDPAGEITVKEFNLDGYNVDKEEKPGYLKYTAKDVMPLEHEYLSPSFYDIAPKVKVMLKSFYLEGVPGDATSWSAFGSWMNDYLIKDSNDLPQATIDHIRALTADLNDDMDKARVVYKYLQDKVRYISVQIEIGGWKPMKASEVDRLSYGDCKALTNYTKNLLDAVGVQSYYTILYAGGQKKSLDKDLVGIQGNHAILALPSGENEFTFLECTSQEMPFGYLGDFTDDRDVLIVTPSGGQMVHTTVYDVDDNIVKTVVDATMDEEGLLMAHLDRDSYGVSFGDHLGLTHLDQKDLNDNYHHEWNMLTGLLVNNIGLDYDDEEAVFNELVEFEVPQYASSINGDIILRPNIFTSGTEMIPPRYSHRKHAFKIEREKQSQQEFNFTLPQGYVIESLPGIVELKTRFGEYKVQMTQDSPNSLKYTRTLILRDGEFTPDLYDEYRSFWKQVARYDNQKIMLNSKT